MTAHGSEIEPRGAGGEPVDLRRTIASHGVADLPPNRIDEQAWTLELTLSLDDKGPSTVLVSEGRKGHAKVEVLAGGADPARVRAAVAHVLRLDEDISPFYEAAAADPELAWVTTGAGRMIRSPTVFEEVVKTRCTRQHLRAGDPPRFCTRSSLFVARRALPNMFEWTHIRGEIGVSP